MCIGVNWGDGSIRFGIILVCNQNISKLYQSGNDLDMLQLAGIGVAMGNGSERCKSVADVIVNAVDDLELPGVAMAIKSRLRGGDNGSNSSTGASRGA